MTVWKGKQMATKNVIHAEVLNVLEVKPEPAPPAPPVPANRLYVFAKNCTNDHGRFVKGDKARGAFSPELVASYVECGILVEVARG